MDSGRNIHETIDAYLAGTLSAEERIQFEQRLKSDADFAQEVSFHELVVQGIKATGEQKLKEQFSKIDKTLPEPAYLPVFVQRYWAAAVVALLIIIAGLYFVLNPEKQKKSEMAQKIIVPDTLKKTAPENHFANEPAHRTSPDSATVKKIETPKKDGLLIAENLHKKYFPPYPNIITGKPRSDEVIEADSLTIAMSLYDDKKFGQALRIFEQLQKDTGHSNYEDILFYSASSLIAERQYSQSQKYFELLRKNKFIKYSQQIEWYQVLVSLGVDNIKLAKVQLSKIIAGNSKYTEKAKALNKELQANFN